MSQLIRTFAAVPLTRPADDLHRSLEELSALSGLRVTKRANLHVTLKYLGETDPADVPIIVDALESCLQTVTPFDWTARGAKTFSSGRKRSVIWADVQPQAAFHDLAEHVIAAVETLGFPRETRPFTPHLTLARIPDREPSELPTWMARNTDTNFHTDSADRVCLYRSRQSVAGVVYEALKSIRL